MNPVSRNISSIRSQHKLTQLQLAKMADVPRATIANIENPNSNPTITAILKIAKALGVTVADLIEKDQYSFATVVKKNEMRTTLQDNNKFAMTLLSPMNAPYIHVNKIRIRPDCNVKGKPHPAGSHEFFYNQEGTAVLEINNKRIELEEGDLVYFAGNLPHRYINEGRKTVNAISVVNMKGS